MSVEERLQKLIDDQNKRDKMIAEKQEEIEKIKKESEEKISKKQQEIQKLQTQLATTEDTIAQEQLKSMKDITIQEFLNLSKDAKDSGFSVGAILQMYMKGEITELAEMYKKMKNQ